MIFGQDNMPSMRGTITDTGRQPNTLNSQEEQQLTILQNHTTTLLREIRKSLKVGVFLQEETSKRKSEGEKQTLETPFTLNGRAFTLSVSSTVSQPNLIRINVYVTGAHFGFQRNIYDNTTVLSGPPDSLGTAILIPKYLLRALTQQ